VAGLLVIAKGSLGYRIIGTALPLTVTEIVVVSTTILVARQIALSVRQFEESVCELAGLHWVQQSLSFRESRREFYSEVRRARRYNRPVALLALKPLAGRPSAQLSRLMDEIQRNVAQCQVDARIASALAAHLHDSELVAKYKSEFIILLPEADGRRAHQVAVALASQIRQELGTEVVAGMATFPDQELTLSGLLERARAGARATPSETENPMAYADDGQAAPRALVTRGSLETA
jgi:hypothetical protein